MDDVADTYLTVDHLVVRLYINDMFKQGADTALFRISIMSARLQLPKSKGGRKAEATPFREVLWLLEYTAPVSITDGGDSDPTTFRVESVGEHLAELWTVEGAGCAFCKVDPLGVYEMPVRVHVKVVP